MTIFHAILLGIVQGLTEFLPISSSAHLVIIPFLFNWQFPVEQIFPFDVLVQMGTLIAVIIYFWKDLVAVLIHFVSGIANGKPFQSKETRMGWYLILATIPAGLIGVFAKNWVASAFTNPAITGVFLLVTAVLLFFAEQLGQQERKFNELDWKDALIMGLFQAVSIFPGISRSGSTITGGMARQLTRPAAARFSFLMSVPIMQAAGLISVLDLENVANLKEFWPVILVGVLVAGIVGYLSIRWLLNYLNRRSLNAFSIYCAAIGVLVLLVAYVR